VKPALIKAEAEGGSQVDVYLSVRKINHLSARILSASALIFSMWSNEMSTTVDVLRVNVPAIY
jgi:hypothetical protein